MEYQKFLSYVVSNLKYMPQEIDRAIRYMENYRCPLSSASMDIVDAIDNAIRDYCDDNDIDYYEFDVEENFDIIIDDIFFDAIEEIGENFN
jgi:hypothetical protein